MKCDHQQILCLKTEPGCLADPSAVGISLLISVLLCQLIFFYLALRAMSEPWMEISAFNTEQITVNLEGCMDWYSTADLYRHYQVVCL